MHIPKALLALFLVGCGQFASASCVFEKQDRKSNALVRKTYDDAKVVGVFEVISTTPPSGEWIGQAGAFPWTVILNNLLLIKGHAGKQITFNAMSPRKDAINLQKSNVYIIAFNHFENDQAYEQNCAWDLREDVGTEAGKFYRRKFLELSKAK